MKTMSSNETTLHLNDEQKPRFIEAAKAGKGLPVDIAESFMTQLFPGDEPPYEPDDGPLTEAQINEIRARAAPMLGNGSVLRRRSLLENDTRYYIITLELDSTQIPNDGLERLKAIAAANGFTWRSQWLVGSPSANPVDAVLLVQTLASELDWFKGAVHDLRLLRVADDVDLTRAIFAYPTDDGALTSDQVAEIKAVASPKLPKGKILKRESLLRKEVFESSNTYVEKYGLPLAKYRMF